jgi:hypothetical protein
MGLEVLGAYERCYNMTEAGLTLRTKEMILALRATKHC